MKNAGSNAWVLTGWQVNPDAKGAGYVAPDPTHSAATTAHGKVGAGFGSSVDQPVRKRQRTAAVRRAVRTVDLTHAGIAVMRTMPDNSVDAIVTDPPNHLTTNKKFGS